MDIRQTNCPSRHKGATWGFLGVKHSKVWEAVKRLDRLAPTLVHVCGFIWEWAQAKSKSPLNTPVSFGGGAVGGHKFKSLGKLSNGCTDWHRTWYTSADSSGNGHTLNTIRHSISQGGLGGHKFKSLGKLSNSWTDWHHIRYTSADSSRNGHMLNTIAPQYPRGILGV